MCRKYVLDFQCKLMKLPSLFPHSGSVLVQLLPYSVNHKCSFQSTALAVGVRYQVRTPIYVINLPSIHPLILPTV